VSSEPGKPAAGRTERRVELQLSVFLRSGDTLACRPLYREIVEQARTAGLRGATAIRGLQGFGDAGTLRSPGQARRTGYEPVRIEITDDPERVRAFLPVLDQLLGSGLVVLRTVTVTRRVADLPDIAATAAS